MAEEFLAIDIGNLHEECAKQADLYHDKASDLATAKYNLDMAKGKLDLVKAQLDKEIRDNPATFGLNKVTEPVVENTIILQQTYQKALLNLNTAKYNVAIHQAAVDALDHKKKGIEDLVKLRLADYYADPKLVAQARQEIENERKAEIRSRGKK